MATTWTMRYTAHLGYMMPDLRPQFLDTVGTYDVVSHVEHAASIGMAGILYPWATERPQREVAAVQNAMKEYGLACSCIVCTPAKVLMSDLWTNRTRGSRSSLERCIATSSKVAGSLGATVLAALISLDPNRDDDLSQNYDDAVDNFHDMACLAQDHGLVLAVEPMTALPNMMLRSTLSALEFLNRVDHPSVGMIFDTAHVARMDGELLTPFIDSFDRISLIQFAQVPGRVELSVASQAVIKVAIEAVRRGYSGLVDLEHEWLHCTREGEAAGLESLVSFDQAIRAGLSPGTGHRQVNPLS